MTFTGNENHTITLEEASKFTRNYREKAPSGAILGGYFGKEALQRVLNQENCVGIRYYHAEKDDGTSVLILVGVDASENDLIGGELLEWSIPCPPYCGSANQLNS
ncbi:MAG: hypothetical protein ACE5OP_01895 [Candidatus Glassbacteria bacterium]